MTVPTAMTCRYAIFPELRLIVEHFSGPLHLDELLTFIHKLWADERYDPTYNIISDLSGATLTITTGEILEFGSFLLRTPGASQGKLAIITNTPIDTAKGLIFKQTVTTLNEVSIFSTWDAACEYIGVAVPLPGPEASALA